jgi:hypothetical protein
MQRHFKREGHKKGGCKHAQQGKHAVGMLPPLHATACDILSEMIKNKNIYMACEG